MKKQDLFEIVRWALLSAVVVTSLSAWRTAQSDGPTGKPGALSANVNGVVVSALAEAGRVPGSVVVKVRLDNPTDHKVDFQASISLVRQEFVGNTNSRAVSINDYRTTPMATHDLVRMVRPNATLFASMTAPAATNARERGPRTVSATTSRVTVRPARSYASQTTPSTANQPSTAGGSGDGGSGNAGIGNAGTPVSPRAKPIYVVMLSSGAVHQVLVNASIPSAGAAY